MKARYLGNSCIGALCVLAFAGAARAQFFSHFETTNIASNTVRVGDSTLRFIPGGTAHRSASGDGSEVTITNLVVDTSSSSVVPDIVDVPYAITMNLLDEASGKSTPAFGPPMVFRGTLKGTVSRDSVQLESVADSPNGFALDLGMTRYMVSSERFSAPSGHSVGALTARVRAAAVPEPAPASLLAGGALPLLSLIRRRK